MLDIKFVRDNPDIIKQNIKNKFQEEKLPLVDQVIDLYAQSLEAKQAAEALLANRNNISKQIGMLKGQAKKNPALAEENEAKIAQLSAQVTAEAQEREALLAKQSELDAKVREIMLVIPNIIDPSVPIGPDDSCNVEVQRFGEPKVPDFPVPY
ncbi:MAG: serine--tRNA ligase, partial [Clostridiales bacterium]|nr:serine--tRNA ligase [Clostridiales bacterium]